jgi:hypothetical protein
MPHAIRLGQWRGLSLRRTPCRRSRRPRRHLQRLPPLAATTPRRRSARGGRSKRALAPLTDRLVVKNRRSGHTLRRTEPCSATQPDRCPRTPSGRVLYGFASLGDHQLGRAELVDLRVLRLRRRCWVFTHMPMSGCHIRACSCASRNFHSSPTIRLVSAALSVTITHGTPIRCLSSGSILCIAAGP